MPEMSPVDVRVAPSRKLIDSPNVINTVTITAILAVTLAVTLALAVSLAGGLRVPVAGSFRADSGSEAFAPPVGTAPRYASRAWRSWLRWRQSLLPSRSACLGLTSPLRP